MPPRSLFRTINRMRTSILWTRFGAFAALGTTVVLVVTVYIDTHERTPRAQTLGDFTILAFSSLAVLACAKAARRPSPTARAWGLLTVAALLWTLGQFSYTFYGVTRDHVYPFPSIADAGYLSYMPFAIAGLLAFPRAGTRGESRVRVILDALVIALALLFISWATVLHRLVEAGGLDTSAGLVGLAYPLVDIAVCSVVLTLAVRQPVGHRLIWILLGGGLVILTVTDTTYVLFVLEGQTALTGTSMVFGWTACFFLMTLATLAPHGEKPRASRDFTLALELIPYVPVVAAVVVAGRVEVHENALLMLTAAALLVVVVLRQVFIVYENVALTRYLERRVASRTADLNVMDSIVRSSTDAVVGISCAGVVLSWNPAAEALYGHCADDVVGHQPEFLSPAQSEGLTRLLHSAQHGADLRGYQVDWTRKDGTVVPVDMTVSPILDGEVLVGISILGQDVTERRRAAEALEAARAEALESSRLKSEFLATMSHEIRTPMNGVIGLSSLLLETPLDVVQRQYAEGVHGAGESLLTLINDILDFSKLEAGKVELEVADFDPRQLVEEVGTLLAPTAFGKDVELLAYCLPEVPRTLRGDVTRIRQIVLNLASNAVKFTSQGEVAVKVRCFPAEEERLMIRVEVSDTGIGIAEQDRDRLFESFAQADSTTTRRYGGTGLGLAISLRLVEAMNGSIQMTSKEGIGSTFWFDIPLAVGTQRPDDLPRFSHDVLPGMRVLVVDDNATNRLILASQLTTWQLQADVVEDAESALAQMRQRALEGRGYDLAILDMCMPRTDGLHLAQAISADSSLKKTVLLMLTSTSHLDTAALHQAGVREWLTKPVRTSELYDRLVKLMAPTKSAPAPLVPAQASPLPAAGVLGRVLVAEDNQINQLVAEKMVSRLGYQVDLVANGAEALEALANASYSAVLMDCHMPLLDGFQATRELRRREPAGQRIPVIAMTAGAMPGDRERCLQAGMDDYVSKPVDSERLETTLARWVQASPSPAIPPCGPERSGSVVKSTSSEATPAIDRQRLELLRRLGSSDPNFVTKLAGIFVHDSASILAQLREAARTHAVADLEAAAHKLNGASGNIGASIVAQLCIQLERTSGSLDGGLTSQLLDQLGVEISRAANALEEAGRQAG